MPSYDVSVANPLTTALASQTDALLPELEAVYKDLHQHPELSMHEVRTAKIAADWLERHGYEVTRGVGKTGVVGVLRNGVGPTVMLRADMDGLPMTEATGLPYASTVQTQDDDGVTVGVFHGCGHDMHVTWLMGAARVLSEHRALWQGTALVVFQPGEEVVTVGALQAGTKENIIPAEATLKLNVRTYDEGVREHVMSAIERVCRAEAMASGAEKPPELTTLSRYPLTSTMKTARSE